MFIFDMKNSLNKMISENYYLLMFLKLTKHMKFRFQKIIKSACFSIFSKNFYRNIFFKIIKHMKINDF